MMTELTLNKPRVLPPKGLLIALGSQLPMVLARSPLRPSTLEITVGAALLVTGLLLNVWADRLFRRNDVGVCPFTHVPVLVDGDPYQITRNPMYLGLVCLNLGVTVSQEYRPMYGVRLLSSFGCTLRLFCRRNFFCAPR
jgi:protein-S-isoprenylcysteine O-methyltransferase Ste14